MAFLSGVFPEPDVAYDNSRKSPGYQPGKGSCRYSSRSDMICVRTLDIISEIVVCYKMTVSRKHTLRISNKAEGGCINRTGSSKEIGNEEWR
jgi:hypothetical protein